MWLSLKNQIRLVFNLEIINEKNVRLKNVTICENNDGIACFIWKGCFNMLSIVRKRLELPPRSWAPQTIQSVRLSVQSSRIGSPTPLSPASECSSHPLWVWGGGEERGDPYLGTLCLYYNPATLSRQLNLSLLYGEGTSTIVPRRKEGTRVPPLNTGTLVSIRWTIRKEKISKNKF